MLVYILIPVIIIFILAYTVVLRHVILKPFRNLAASIKTEEEDAAIFGVDRDDEIGDLARTIQTAWTHISEARDLREHKKMLKDIEQRDVLLSTVNTAITVLLQSEVDEFESALWNSMGIMAEALEVDRVRLWKNHREDGKLYCTQLYEWSEGATPQQGTKITIKVPYDEDLPGWEEKLSHGECINRLTRDASPIEQKRFSSQDILSVLIVPVFLKDEFWGFVGFNDCHRERIFTENEESILRSASLLIANALLRYDMTQELATALEKTKAASQSKSNFLSNMSHEIRTPINAIVGMTMIGKSTTDVERKNYAFEKIEVASSHLLGVINDVLDMSKIEANKYELSSVEFDFEKMLKRVVNVIVFRVKEKNQRLTVGLDSKIPQRLIGDDQRLAQVITNLLSNAVKFTPEDGTISLHIRLVSEKDCFCTIEIEVTDTGIGISDEQLERLFTSFEQAESNITRRFGGTGLGLAISKQIVELMGGEINVESEVGKGAKFVCTINLRIAQCYDSQTPQVVKKDIRVLIVENEPETLEFFDNLIQRIGIEYDVAESKREALEMIGNDKKYNICFIAWKTPGADGIELSRLLREACGYEPAIIVMSAYDWILVEQDARAAGVSGFLSKPLFASDVVDCINTYIGTSLSSKSNEAEPALAVSFKGRHLLLVEDVEINQEIVLSLLEPTELEIDCASNGAEAVRMFSESPGRYDMIFMDIQMPEMDGLTATRIIRAMDFEKARTIPIVAMTANVYREDIEKCLEAGLNEHVGKPIDFDEVMATLKKYIVP